MRVLNVGLEFSRSSKNRERCFSSCHKCGTKKKNSESPWGIKPQTFRSWVWGSIPYGDSEFFSLSQARDKTKNIFLYFFSKPKTYHLSYSMYRFQKNKKKIHASAVCYMLTNLNLAFSYFSILIFYDIFTVIWCRFVVTWTTVLGIAFLLLNKL